MEEYTFHRGHFSPRAEFLFNHPDHLRLQAAEGWHCFYVLNLLKKCVAFIHLHVEENIATSPRRAPFGSLEFHSTVPTKILDSFLTYLEEKLNSLGAEKILIKSPPDLFQPEKNSLTETLLLNHGYQVSSAETGAVMEVDSKPLKTRMHAWEKRKLRQAVDRGLVFEKISLKSLEPTYQFIESCRSKKKYELSMSYKDLKQAASIFPKNFFLFKTQLDRKTTSACIAIRVSRSILYTFYYDHDRHFDSISPNVVLIEGIYRFCQTQKIKLLDLGTSMAGDKINFKLLDFKVHLGARPTPKLTFEKILS